MTHRYSTIVLIAYGTIGDFMLNLSIVRALHASSPTTPVVVITTRQAPLYKEAVGNLPYIEVRGTGILELVGLYLRLFARRNLILLPTVFGTHVLPVQILSWVLRGRGVRAGIRGPKDEMYMEVAVPLDITRPYHQNLQTLATALGCSVPIEAELDLPHDESVAAQFKGAPYITLAPFAGHHGKTFPPGRWVSLLEHLARAHPAMHIAVLGAPTDAPAAADLVAKSGHSRARVCCGITFSQTVGLMRRCALFIGVDSGLTHVAGVLGVKSVIAGNLRNPSWLPYYNPRAAVLFSSKHCVCRGDKTGDCLYEIDGKHYLRCMMDISDDALHVAIAEALK